MRGRRALDVRVRLLPEPGLWSWEIVDRSGALVYSSWAAEWSAYESREEALAAGGSYLAELVAVDAADACEADRSKEEHVA